MVTFELFVSYSQICVFNAELTNPFNDWTDSHVQQGFTWRKGSVSFGTLEGSGKATISFEVVQEIRIDQNAVRAILLPFTITDKQIEIATISDSQPIAMKNGNYALLFQICKKNEEIFYLISLKQQETVEPQILKRDAGIIPQHPLVMSANPAI